MRGKLMIKFCVVCLALVFFMLSCKSTGENGSVVSGTSRSSGAYDGIFEKGFYVNNDLGLKIHFDADWVIKSKFVHFNKSERKYSTYLDNGTSVLLFTGYSEVREIGMRCRAERLNTTPEKHFNYHDSKFGAMVSKYKITFKTKESVTYRGVEGYRTVMETKINPNNTFIFDSFYFRRGEMNYKLDIWMKGSKYENFSDIITGIYNSIDFIDVKK